MLGIRVRYARSILTLGTIAGLVSGCAERSDDSVDAESFVTESEAPKGHLAQTIERIGRMKEATKGEELEPRAERAEAQPLQHAPELLAARTEVRTFPGKAARTIVDQEANEAENLFFTDEGRLFVSANHDIYEYKRKADGTFTRTDHFHDDECVVEGIVESRGYLYGVCWKLKGLTLQSFFIAGELTADPTFRIVADLKREGIPNGMTVDPEGRIYAADSIKNEIIRWTLASPLELGREELWLSHQGVNGLKYVDGAIYTSRIDGSLVSHLDRIPMLSNGGAGKPQRLYSRALTVLDDIEPFEGGFVLTDFLAGTLIFWDEQRGVYGETPRGTFYGPSALAVGQAPMFTNKQLVVMEKGNFLILDERRGDLVSMYQLQ